MHRIVVLLSIIPQKRLQSHSENSSANLCRRRCLCRLDQTQSNTDQMESSVYVTGILNCRSATNFYKTVEGESETPINWWQTVGFLQCLAHQLRRCLTRSSFRTQSKSTTTKFQFSNGLTLLVLILSRSHGTPICPIFVIITKYKPRVNILHCKRRMFRSGKSVNSFFFGFFGFTMIDSP